MDKEEPAWRAELRGSLEALTEWAFEKGPGLTKAGMEIVLPHILAAERRGRREAWDKAMDIADEAGAYLRRNYETEQSNGAYVVLEDLKREAP
jgi:hypothetical protein